MTKSKIYKHGEPPISLVELSIYDLLQIWNRVRAELGFREVRNIKYTRTHLIRLINRDYRKTQRKKHAT